jgi:DNA-binding transcriptional MocR family regulator
LFFWLTLNQAIDTRPLLNAAIARNVAYMPGEAFFADDHPPLGGLRLNFSLASDDEAERGLAVLAALFREILASRRQALAA